MDTKPIAQFTLSLMTESDIEEVASMRLQSQLETYVNDSFGVTREWMERRNQVQMSAEKVEFRLELFKNGKANGTLNGWVARDSSKMIIGSTTPFVDEGGTQRVGSLYVDKKWHGVGVSSELMQKVIDWFDDTKPIELMVATYNERAKAFYRKWGFEEVPGSEALFDDMIPEVKMTRRPRL